MPGSHSVPLSTTGREILDNKALPSGPVIRHIPQVFAVGGPLTGLTRDVQRGRGQPPGFRPESKVFAANSPVSPVDRVAFVDGPFQRGGPKTQTADLFNLTGTEPPTPGDSPRAAVFRLAGPD